MFIVICFGGSQRLAQCLDAVEDAGCAGGSDPNLVGGDEQVVGFGLGVTLLESQQDAVVLRTGFDGNARLDGNPVAEDVFGILLQEKCVTLHFGCFGRIADDRVAVEDVVGAVGDGVDGLWTWNDIERGFDDGTVVAASREQECCRGG